MDFLNHAFRQVKDLFNSMTPGARITAGLLLIVIVTSLSYLFRYSSPSVDEPLLDGRPFLQNEMVDAAAAFATAGLTDYETDKGRIMIPRGKSDLYVGALAASNALPADFNDYLDAALEANGIWDNRYILNQRDKHNKMKRLKMLIEAMTDIQSAMVEYDEMKKRGFRGGKEVTAAVAVSPVGGKEIEMETVKGIKKLVAASIAGLSPKDVAVMDQKTSRTYSSSSEGGMTGVDDDPYAARKKMYQRDWEEKISKALSYIDGAIVAVNVELTTALHHQENKITYDAKSSVATDNLEETESSSTIRPDTGGRTGVNGQANLATQTQSNTSEDSLETSRTDTKTIPGGDQVSTIKAPLTPSQAKATISIPSTYYQKLWELDNPTVPGQPPPTPLANEMAAIETKVTEDIQDVVATLLKSVALGDDPYPLVQVKKFHVFPEVPIPDPTMSEGITTWLGQNWSTLGMVFVGMFSLLILRSMVNSTPPLPPTNDSPAANLSLIGTEDEEEVDMESIEQKARKRFSASGPNLRDDLSQMVEDDLDASANILRNWIGDVG